LPFLRRMLCHLEWPDIGILQAEGMEKRVRDYTTRRKVMKVAAKAEGRIVRPVRHLSDLSDERRAHFV
jgi:hypothetical protein